MDADRARDTAIIALDRWHKGCTSPALLVAALEAVIRELRLCGVSAGEHARGNHRQEVLDRVAQARDQRGVPGRDLPAHLPAGEDRAVPARLDLRYSVNGKQREQSFRDDTDPATGRVRHGTGKGKAKDAQLKLTHDKRAQGQVFADPKAGSVNFGRAAEAHLSRLAVNNRTRETYLGNYRTRVRPALGSLTVAQVAVARDTVADLLAVSMREASIGTRRITRMIIRPCSPPAEATPA